MLSRAELLQMARTRLKDAKVLLAGKQYDGAVYLCGYSVECALKARIVAVLKWPGFPQTRKEFEKYQSFRTHDLAVLLTLSGREQTVKNKHWSNWTGVSQWDPEARYRVIGSAQQADAENMIQCAKALLRVL